MSRRRRAASRLLILTWHNVHPTWCFPARRGTGVQGLARQLAFCRRAASVVPLDAGVRALVEGTPLPPRAVALTFDDGYRDSLEAAVPLLRRLGLPATFFLVPGLLSGTARPWWETVAWTLLRARAESAAFEGRRFALRTPAERVRAAREVGELLKRRDSAGRDAALEELRGRCRPAGEPPGHELFLGWEGARELVRRGFAVGSHSMGHHILSKEDAASQREDLAGSRRQLEAGLQVGVPHFAYPNGKAADYGRTTLDAARRAGYVSACTTLAGRNTAETPRYELRRFVLSPERGLGALPLLPRQWLGAARSPSKATEAHEEAHEEAPCASCT